MAGLLYLCATPIGNLEDMTYRAVRILGEVDLIAAEDTRHTRKLLTHFDLHTPLISYHEHNKLQRGPELIALLKEGKQIAVVSDAGLPGIADPGAHLAELAIAEDIPVTPLPGANAALAGLICSGLDTTRFHFVGFLPKTVKKRRQVLESVRKQEGTLLFYESPHRLKETLKELSAVLGNRRTVAARELTKKFEEFIRGTTVSLCDRFDGQAPRGEFTLIVEGYKQEETVQAFEPQFLPAEAVLCLMESGVDKKTAIKTVAKEQKISKREVYQAVLATEKAP